MFDAEKLSKTRTGYSSVVQWIVALGVSLLMLNVGIQTGWISPNLANLIDENSAIPLTTTEASWLLSFNALGSIIGSFLVFFIMELIGHRRTILLIFAAMSLSWGCVVAANSKEWLFIAQFLNGLTLPLSLASFSLFVGEVSTLEVRDTFISIATTGNAIGMIIGLVFGTYISMQMSALIYCIGCILAISLFSWLLDSPQYLIKLELFEKAKKSAAFYSLGSDFVQNLRDKNEFMEHDGSKNMMSKLFELKVPFIRKAVILVVIIFLLPNLAGVFCIMAYMEIILESGQVDLIKSEQFVIYANVISVIASILTVNLMNKFGRRLLLTLSNIAVIISLVGVGAYFYLLHHDFNVKNHQWLLYASILLNLLSYTVGSSRIAATLTNEILSVEMRNLGACLSNLINFILSFLLLLTYQPVIDSLGEEYVFWIYAALTFLVSLYTFFSLPETKGKRLDDIQKKLMK